jgi:hypothetical protein
MADLTLHVKRKYFEQIASGEKGEEYRLATPYWKKRLEGREYERVVICLGYPKRDDTSRRLVFPWRGAERKTIVHPHPHFGDAPVDVYAVRLTPVVADGANAPPLN